MKDENKDKNEICCGNCRNFFYEDTNGLGYCKIFNIMTTCDEECAEWEKEQLCNQ